MDLLVERVFAIDEENLETLLRQQASTLKPGKSGANDSHIVEAGRHVSDLTPHAGLPSSTLQGKDAGNILGNRHLW